MAAGPEDGARADLEEDGFEIVSESGSVGGKSKTLEVLDGVLKKL